MKRVGTFITGLLVGATLFGGTAAYAAGVMAEQSMNRFLVDGQEVQLNAYAINGSNYLKLRDIGEVVGFNVYWGAEKHCVQIEGDKPYTDVAPIANNEDTPPLAGYEQSERKPVPHAGDVILCSDAMKFMCSTARLLYCSISIGFFAMSRACSAAFMAPWNMAWMLRMVLADSS